MKLFEITTDPLSTDDVIARMADPAAGGVNTFVGVVRGQTEGQRTLYLEYEAYAGMAEDYLRQVGDEVRERWPTIHQVAIVHRTGRLKVGEKIVVIAVSSAHRQDLFDATHYAIDRLKEIVPIWKKEVSTEGEIWKSDQSQDVEEGPGS
jgi:molybdopterin synthase catalytic subunit